MKKEKSGFAAFDKESGKGLSVFVGMISSAKTSLTNDPEKVELAPSYGEAELYTIWFNNQHKNKKEFEIKEVVRSIEIRR